MMIVHVEMLSVMEFDLNAFDSIYLWLLQARLTPLANATMSLTIRSYPGNGNCADCGAPGNISRLALLLLLCLVIVAMLTRVLFICDVCATVDLMNFFVERNVRTDSSLCNV
jgi:energy-converting hydrogenase Eha subunit B